jgi:tetratricopeptide (TPR) repeat protein
MELMMGPDTAKQISLRGKLCVSVIGRRFWAASLLMTAVLLAGCHGDPNARKQKYLESGKRYSAEGKYNEAVIQFSNALKNDNAYPEAHLELARAYMHLSRFGAAYGEYMRTVSLQPSNVQARLELGSLLLAAGKTDAAQEQADAVKNMQPDNPDLHALLAGLQIKRGQKAEALAEIQRALALDPKRTTFHEDLALIQSGDPNNAANVEKELKTSVDLDPKSVDPRLLLAGFYGSKGRWSEAESTLREAIAANPKSVPAREGLAEMYLRQGNQASAEEVLRQASHDLADNPNGAAILANYHSRTGQVDKAKSEFATLAAKYPKNLGIQQAYVRTLLQVKDYAAAQPVVAELMKHNGKNPQVLALNGILLLNEGKANDAANALHSAARDYPNDPFIQFWLGRAEVAKGDLHSAEGSFRRTAELAPSNLEALSELALIAAQRGDMDLLSDAAAKAIAGAPRAPIGYVLRAVVEISRSEFDKAEADLKQAINVAPQSAPAYLQLGKLRFAQAKYADGVPFLEQALQYDVNSVEAMRLLLSYDLFQKHPDKALARLNAQILKSPQNSTYQAMLAKLQLQSGNPDAAAATAQKAIKLNPDDAEAFLVYAQIQIQNGQVAEAITAWEQWSNAHPNDAGALALLGTLEGGRGNEQKARAYYKKALQIQPEQPLAANNLAYMMLQNDENPDIALNLAQTARRLMPNSSDAADTLAWAYYKKGAYSFARDLLEEALKTSADNATMQYHLGIVYSKLENKNNAVIHLKKAIVLAPESSSAKDAKVALGGLDSSVETSLSLQRSRK